MNWRPCQQVETQFLRLNLSAQVVLQSRDSFQKLLS